MKQLKENLDNAFAKYELFRVEIARRLHAPINETQLATLLALILQSLDQVEDKLQELDLRTQTPKANKSSKTE